MKFLVDRCAGRRLVVWLRNEGHDVAESSDSGEDPGDDAILQRALAESRVLITMNKDFGELVFRQRHAHAGLVRLPDVPADRRIVLMHRLLDNYEKALSSGAVITVRGGRIRISLP